MLARQQMRDRLAMEFQGGWIVSLGVGMPALCSKYVDPHSDGGVVGYGPSPQKAVLPASVELWRAARHSAARHGQRSPG